MNIFVLSLDPNEAARMHCDKHCVKMVLETAQLLCTAWRVGSSNPPEGIYQATHVNHPCAIWVRESRANYAWAYELFLALLDEYKRRYHKEHACGRFRKCLAQIPECIPDLGDTFRPQCMPDYCQNPNVVTAYRQYYINEKHDLAKWAHSDTPDWWIE